ncbi:MAG: group II intron reverse transcriptase/maturase [Planctomycetota bacterium]|nr:group II intron reverse transcriptase/maturase [Planctomycetota bacterium]
MKRQSQEPLPERVPFSATPPGETPEIRRWAQPVVWTERMLTTLLENKVRGGKWHALIDKVYSELNLYTAARRVTRQETAAGVDGQSCDEIEEHLLVETQRLSEQIQAQIYRPQAVRRVHIPKPGRPNETRPLGIPTIRDRVVQRAVVNVIEPILDHQFHERSFGFRHGRGAHGALRIVEQKLQEGYVYVVDADLKGYFDTIPKDRLLMFVKEHISDSRMLTLIRLFLDQNILEELREWTPIAGVPQGAVLSPVLSNLYLNPLGHLMSDHGYEMVRYADDFVVLCRTLAEAASALQMITQWVVQAGLTLHPTKTKIVDSRVESFAFLGYSFRGDRIYPRRESLAKMKTRIRDLTPRERSGSLKSIAADLNSVLRGWFGYFRHCRWTIFKDLDAKIRSRLRRLLLKRHRKNPERLPRHKRWPNAYFANMGLYSLREAHFRFAQSGAGNH